MKNLRRYLPVLILILALILLLTPARNSGEAMLPAATETAAVGAAADSGIPANTENDRGSGELQLLEPAEEPDGQAAEPEVSQQSEGEQTPIAEDGSYTTREDVALYLQTYGHLPPNFVTKAEAEKAGWTGGSLEYVLPGKCIGGDRFGNREGQLPKAKGRTWWECDINTLGRRSRGAERLVYSSDGLIYYTPDHYETFERLY